nr:hypothetical protein [bacterium]
MESRADLEPRLRVIVPNDESMRISHEAIYQPPYMQGSRIAQRVVVC